ncbi:hypothetical protein OAT18_03545 [Tenacibaculum sp.]|nr:hypothetical protein [Tenacibaculum sp.]
MSLIIYPYKRHPNSNEIEGIDEKPMVPHNDLFGSENWRYEVWGSLILNNFDCKLLPSLINQDIYAENGDILILKTEIETLKENIDYLSGKLDIRPESFEFRLDNAIEAIRLALKIENGGVYIG